MRAEISGAPDGDWAGNRLLRPGVLKPLGQFERIIVSDLLRAKARPLDPALRFFRQDPRPGTNVGSLQERGVVDLTAS